MYVICDYFIGFLGKAMDRQVGKYYHFLILSLDGKHLLGFYLFVSLASLPHSWWLLPYLPARTSVT